MDDLNKYISQLDLRDNGIFHPATAEYTFFLSIHKTFSRISHLLSHKTSFNTFRRAENILLVQSFIRSPFPNTRFSTCTFTSNFGYELYVPTLFQFILLLRFSVDVFLSQPILSSNQGKDLPFPIFVSLTVLYAQWAQSKHFCRSKVANQQSLFLFGLHNVWFVQPLLKDVLNIMNGRKSPGNSMSSFITVEIKI